MMITKIRPNIKFIISGHYSQVLPFNDRISPITDYSNSPCLFELADYNKLQLTTCSRADANVKPSDFKETNEYQ